MQHGNDLIELCHDALCALPRAARRPWRLACMVAAVFLADALAAEPISPGPAPQSPLRELVVSRWSTDDGLPVNTLTNVLQTHDGYLWIASYNGLIRFDGSGFTVFDKRNLSFMETNGFHELVEDRHGTLWIGTQNSDLLRYRHGKFESLPIEEETHLTVRTIWIDDDNTVWVGTSGHGAYRYEGSRFTQVDAADLIGVTVRDIIRDASGALWFATAGNGLIRLEDGVYTVYDSDVGLISDAVTSLCQARDGTIWIGTQEGLSRLDQDEISSIATLANVEVYHVYEDGHGSLWLATEQGLFRSNIISGGFERLRTLEKTSLRSISALAFDREGSVWIAAYSAGLLQLKTGKFKNYTLQDGLGSARVNAVYETGDGRYLVGVDGGIINTIDGETVDELEFANPLPDVRIRGILQDSRGRWWVASYAGLLKISDGEEILYTTDNGLPTNQIRLVYEDRSGRIWIGTRNAGLLELTEDGRFRAIDKTAGMTSDFVFSVEEGLGGELLIGTYEGLSVLSPDGSIARYTAADGLPGGIVFSTFADDDGAIWLCTNGGLARLHQKKIKKLTSNEGLPKDTVFDYEEDGRLSVWLSSVAGVIQVSKQQLNAYMEGERSRVDMVVYDDRDGMYARESTGATKILKASDGRLWFPTLGGLSVIDPNNIRANRVVPPVKIDRFVVDSEAIDLHDVAGGKIELGPGKKEYVIGFAALSFIAPSKVAIKYKLVGFDDDWIEADKERTVRYTNLAPLDYSFRVIASNSDGIWNEQGATLEFRVTPLFYQHPLFIAAAVLLVAVGIRGVYSWRMRAANTRNAQLESVIEEQKRAEREKQELIEELESRNEEMERFTYTVSHDLKSPLFTIRGFLGMLGRDVASGNVERMNEDMKRIDAATKKMAQLLDELLELSRVGRMVNAHREVAVAELAREAVEQVQGRITARGVKVEISSDLPMVYGDRQRLLELFQNLIDNSVKFMGDQPRPLVEVGAGRHNSEQVCYVRDNGIGIEPQYHDKVFGLFERLNQEVEGTGVGLALVKRIVDVHGGRIWVESEGLGHGSRFCFTLPPGGAQDGGAD